MNPAGEWRLWPAFDVSYAYNPQSSWTPQHQMSLNGKRDHFELDDLVRFGVFCGFKPPRARAVVEEVHAQVGQWLRFAEQAGVDEGTAARIQRSLRLGIVDR